MARALGKVILFGEHSVVYGVPAIAAGIQRGAEASAARAAHASLQLGELPTACEPESEPGRAFAALLATLSLGEFEVHATTELPPGCGLGASASLGVAIARAVLEVAASELPISETQRWVLEAADAWERVFHDNPSGIDAAAATVGGCFRYTRALGPQPLQLAKPFTLAIAIAGPPAPTAEMVRGVARLKERRPELVAKTLEGIASIVSNAEICLKMGDFSGLGKLMDFNQMLLAGLFVSTPEIEDACQVARSAGALGAKLTGAGGGGAVIALTEGDPNAVLDAWKHQGFEAFFTTIG